MLHNRWHLILPILFLVAWPPCTHACQIPVFRYALERWEPIPFEVVVFHRGPFNAKDKTSYESLRSAGIEDRNEINYVTRDVDLASAVSDDDRNLFESQPHAPIPCITLLMPPTITNRTVIWAAPLTSENVRILVDSPARREIVKRLVGGASAVWVLIEGPRKEDNDAAAATITKQIAEDQKEIRLPDGASEASMQGGPGLKIAFSLVRIAHSDPAEEIFAKILQSLDPDFAKDLPVAIPIFGRGRAPNAFSRDNITPENIHQTDEFICGPCACEIKEQNPGIDLLFAADWNNAFADSQPGNLTAPSLTGISQLAPPASATPDTGTPTSSQAALASNTLNRNITILVIASLLVVATVSMLLKIRAKKMKDNDEHL